MVRTDESEKVSRGQKRKSKVRKKEEGREAAISGSERVVEAPTVIRDRLKVSRFKG